MDLIKKMVIMQKLDPKDKQYIYEISLDMTNLHDLYVCGNPLTEINENAFIGLNSLQRLYLCFNLLVDIKENAFIGLENLQVLHLYKNQLSEIEENTFT